MNLLNSDGFWQFACTLYAKPGQQHTLLALQNQQGKNVNLCLLLLYLDSLKLSINAEQLSTLIESIDEFDTQALKPLRSVRRYLKANQETIADYTKIREELLSAELKLEKQQQHMLIDTVNGFELVACTAPDNSALYL
ncbi:MULTISPECIES: TIGR02444 family protein [unclassified Pseudoalteromonas]|uniref:TIGR02444 family protein n=1 Tax=unclassified Pseudoalteromonas TaxID=194690 RepID=UPI001109CF88|nr:MULTISPECIES: TIGR02444 family protein [unclassified Pseudoalteromonas]TMN80982.1 TIGR02444 family protein [Pseudoalteromonas sp. S410]TMN87727.1 TIGR02444 family protein [Pseudoalteromonas sp. S408]TMN94773.1 TIGR02444 family protein [Pseudoalteromonas sp. S407]TMO02526.1 TIGR02444 family protein [Pseudoalteromonas sp. S409]TMO08735.1 TIGR02444 family protein [Pseudoalteromonas sp. S186]